MVSVKHWRCFNDLFADGIEPPDLGITYDFSFSPMLADILCSLCDSVQNQRQKRRCKRQNCIFTGDAW